VLNTASGRAAMAMVIACFASIAAGQEREPDPICADDRFVLMKPEAIDAVGSYRSTLGLCRASRGETAVAIRSFLMNGERGLLLVDPDRLTTRLARAVCWRCEDVGDDALGDTRLAAAIAQSSEPPPLLARGVFESAGLAHGKGPGSYVTADLCPSPYPLDRAFFDALVKAGPHTPLAIAISGLWLLRHPEDFAWLKALDESGALDILWVNHSFHHPYNPRAPDQRNFLLAPGTDVDAEVLDTERLLIANGVTPSVFFRFPGLVASAPLLQAVRRHHLVAVGADA